MVDKLRVDELKDIVKSLCSTIKCAVCLGALQRDTLTCVNGHCICVKCQGKQECCPTCREDFSNVKQNSLVRQILDITPHTCQYDKCDHLVRPKEDHESYCKFKPTFCKLCETDVPAVELVDHVRDEHGDKYIFSGNTARFGTSVVNVKASNVTSLHHSFEHLLWQILRFEPTTSVLTVTYIPVFCGKPNNDICVKISLDSEEEYEASKKIKMNVNVNPDEENCLLIPISGAQQCVLKDKIQVFQLNITKKD